VQSPPVRIEEELVFPKDVAPGMRVDEVGKGKLSERNPGALAMANNTKASRFVAKLIGTLLLFDICGMRC